MMNVRNIWREVYQLDELFFFALYGFKAVWVLGKLPIKAANRIKRLCGFDVKDFDVVIRSNYLVHFYNSHYRSQEDDLKKRPITIEDIRSIPFVICHFYDAEASTDGKNDSIIMYGKTPSGRVEIVLRIDYFTRTLSGVSFRSST